MPTLKDPEVVTTAYSEEFYLLSQPNRMDEIKFGDSSLNAELVMNGQMGLNPLCNEITVSYHMARAMHDANMIKLSLHLHEDLHGKKQFLKDLGQLHVIVQEEPDTYRPGLSRLSVTGLNNILKFAEYIRGHSDTSPLEVDQLERTIIHPELLGLALEAVDQEAIALSGVEKKGFAHTAYRHDWA